MLSVYAFLRILPLDEPGVFFYFYSKMGGGARLRSAPRTVYKQQALLCTRVSCPTPPCLERTTRMWCASLVLLGLDETRTRVTFLVCRFCWYRLAGPWCLHPSFIVTIRPLPILLSFVLS